MATNYNVIQEVYIGKRRYYIHYGILSYGSFDDHGNLSFEPVSKEIMTNIILGLLNEVECED